MREIGPNEGDEDLDKDVVNSMHFGGGMVPKIKAAVVVTRTGAMIEVVEWKNK